ncbi:MAG: transcription termination/antitermination NusG family protein [Gammaproteobacteria bacterium]|nr:transcription termination/antitermination NusG family protein [Gammaproteobacteria bacterium]MDP2346976.1 transcription termination/antitermination NusG family protein [Gammaproteobacteria bacterium]
MNNVFHDSWHADHALADETCAGRFRSDDFQKENAAPSNPSWHVLWTHSNHERAVYEMLSAKGYELLFARIDQWVANKKGKHLARVPMFRSYLFINHAIGKHDYIDISNTKGMVRILGDRWDRLAIIPNQEINDIKSLCCCDTPVSSHPFLNRGDKVRVTRGSLKNTQGILVKSDQHTGLLVVSVSLLNRSVAVEVNCTDVVPI